MGAKAAELGNEMVSVAISSFVLRNKGQAKTPGLWFPLVCGGRYRFATERWDDVLGEHLLGLDALPVIDPSEV